MKITNLSTFPRLCILAAVLLLPRTAFAGFCDTGCTFTSLDGQQTFVEGVKPTPTRDSIGVVLSEIIPIMPLEKGSSEFKINLIQWSHTQFSSSVENGKSIRNYDQSVDGYAFAFSYTKGLSKEYGWSVIGAFTNGNGNTSRILQYTQRTYAGERGDTGYLAAISLVRTPQDNVEWFQSHGMLGIDFFSESGGYSIPFTFENNVGVSTVNRIGHLGNYKSKSNSSGVGIFGAWTPEIRSGPIGWGPIMYGGGTLSKTVYRETITDLTTGESASGTAEGVEGVFGVGLRVVYRPWNISMTYMIPTAVLTGHSSKGEFNAISLSKSW